MSSLFLAEFNFVWKWQCQDLSVRIPAGIWKSWVTVSFWGTYGLTEVAYWQRRSHLMVIVSPGFGLCFHRVWNKALAWLLLPVGNIMNTTNYCWLLNQSRQSGTVKYREVCGQTGRAPATSARRFNWASSGDLLYWVCIGRWREVYGVWFSPPSGWSGYKSCFVFGFELPLGDQLYEGTFFLIFPLIQF